MDNEPRTARIKFGPVGKCECVDVKLEWGPPFNSNDYTVSAIVEDSSPLGENLRVDRIRQRTQTAATFQDVNRSNESKTGILHAGAKHDD